jgi:hypothetical protein
MRGAGRSYDAAGPRSPRSPWRRIHAAVQRLLGQLETLSAVRFQSDAPTNADIEEWGFNSPEREITLTLGGASTATQVTLQIGQPDQARERRLCEDRRPALRLRRRAGHPEATRARRPSPGGSGRWRRSLPRPGSRPWRSPISPTTRPSTRTSSSDGQTWDTALVSETAPHRDAIMAILGQLRALRAASFAQDGFPDKVLAAGEMRPWKYRLDATVSLPGGRRSGEHDDPLVCRAHRRYRTTRRLEGFRGGILRSNNRCWTLSSR